MRSWRSIAILFFVCAFLFNPRLQAQTAVQPSGSGTAVSPYQVDSLPNLYWITQNSSSWGSYFVQLTNIDASSSSTWDSDSGFTPIGNGTTQFTGTYDGELHTITGIHIDRVTTTYVGMFGLVNGGKIENLGLVNESIKGKTDVGGLAGDVIGVGTIVNCCTTGSVYNSISQGGGLVGLNVGGHISRCYSAAADSGGGYVGGLVGENDDTVSNCYALGNVSFSIDEPNAYPGGLVGYNTKVILNSYSIGEVSNPPINQGGGGLVGGINTNTVRNSFWDETTSGFPTSFGSNGGTGETDAAMKSVTLYADSGWDFDSTWAFSSNLNNSYPALLWQYATYPSGSGTSGNPYLISSFGNLLWIAINPGLWSSYFQQTADINADSSSWFYEGVGPIGYQTARFAGTYDGQLHTIAGIHIDRVTTTNVGMFGYVGSATIENLGLVNESIKGFQNVGGLVGEAQTGTTIVNCYTTGSVYDSISQGGGLVGLNVGGHISRCYSAAADSGGGYVGGLVGENVDTVSNCYALGNVSFSINNSNAYPGGLVGYNTKMILNSYSIGDVSNPSNGQPGGLVGGINTNTVRNSFWDETTSGFSVSNGGTGETDATMKTATIYTDSGWDFSGTWAISGGVNSGYPYLLSLGASQSLPVELASFSVRSVENGVAVQWTTATEVNDYGFDIERKAISGQQSAVSATSSNPQSEIGNSQWLSAGFVKGAGSSNAPHEYSFTDNGLAPGLYSYRVKQIDRNGSFTYSREAQVDVGSAPMTFSLNQNYPNPFNPTTTLEFTLPADGRVTLKVYDIVGREVATLLDGNRKAGEYQQVVFDASRLSSGVYFAVLQGGGKRLLKKMLLLK